MSDHATTNSHTAGHDDDPHNHKHSGNVQTLSLSDRFFEPLDRQVVAWLDLKPGSRVLDAGCGCGGMTRLLAEAVGPGGEVVGVDTSPQMLEWAKTQAEKAKLGGRIKFQEGDVRALPFEDAGFDLVWCSRVVHGLNDQLAGVRELVRVIRPGGRLVLREGGLPLQFMPYDLGLGAPGLEGRLAAAHEQWFANWRNSLPDVVAYPYGWTHLLREAGLNSVAPRSFLYDLTSPLEDFKVEYLKTILNRHPHDSASQELLAAQDVQTLKQLLDPASPHYVFDRDDLHGIVVETIYTGTVG
jgi:ubiquinone/menaquinone biosynthesis C-methylase UbiE